MAVEKASLMKILDYKGGAVFRKQASLSLVKDPYSGKYYGSEAYAEVKGKLSEAIQYYNNQIHTYSKGVNLIRGGVAPVPNSIAGAGINPLVAAKEALAKIETFHLPDEGMYVQKPMMVESFNKNPDAWNSFFEGSYKNPRLSEEASLLARQNQDSLVEATADSIRKKSIATLGTGISTTGTTNPFGSMDTGLGI